MQPYSTRHGADYSSYCTSLRSVYASDRRREASRVKVGVSPFCIWDRIRTHGCWCWVHCALHLGRTWAVQGPGGRRRLVPPASLLPKLSPSTQTISSEEVGVVLLRKGLEVEKYVSHITQFECSMRRRATGGSTRRMLLRLAVPLDGLEKTSTDNRAQVKDSRK